MLSKEMMTLMGNELNKRVYAGSANNLQSMGMKKLPVDQVRSGEISHGIVEFISNAK